MEEKVLNYQNQNFNISNIKKVDLSNLNEDAQFELNLGCINVTAVSKNNSGRITYSKDELIALKYSDLSNKKPNSFLKVEPWIILNEENENILKKERKLKQVKSHKDCSVKSSLLNSCRQKKRSKTNTLPEFFTCAPNSMHEQIDLNGFNSNIENSILNDDSAISSLSLNSPLPNLKENLSICDGFNILKMNDENYMKFKEPMDLLNDTQIFDFDLMNIGFHQEENDDKQCSRYLKWFSKNDEKFKITNDEINDAKKYMKPQNNLGQTDFKTFQKLMSQNCAENTTQQKHHFSEQHDLKCLKKQNKTCEDMNFQCYNHQDFIDNVINKNVENETQQPDFLEEPQNIGGDLSIINHTIQQPKFCNKVEESSQMNVYKCKDSGSYFVPTAVIKNAHNFIKPRNSNNSLKLLNINTNLQEKPIYHNRNNTSLNVEMKTEKQEINKECAKLKVSHNNCCSKMEIPKKIETAKHCPVDKTSGIEDEVNQSLSENKSIFSLLNSKSMAQFCLNNMPPIPTAKAISVIDLENL